MGQKIYREAAKAIANGESIACCYAIAGVEGIHYTDKFVAKKQFCNWFRPPEGEYKPFWYGEVWNDESNLARSLGLLLMHELEKDGQL
jgi:hypothetical protein